MESGPSTKKERDISGSMEVSEIGRIGLAWPVIGSLANPFSLIIGQVLKGLVLYDQKEKE